MSGLLAYLLCIASENDLYMALMRAYHPPVVLDLLELASLSNRILLLF